MKAAVWNGPFDLTAKDMPIPVPAKDEVLIKTKSVGICGSDLEIYDGRFTQSEPPLILGHEGGGIIESVGGNVSTFQMGDRVVASGVLYCGECVYCKNQQYGLCDHLRELGMIGAHGEYAEYFVAPAKNCHLLPDGLTWLEAGLIDTLAGPIHGLSKIHIEPGSSVAVFGDGPAGLFFCNLCKLREASRVFLIGNRENRLEMGTTYGADVRLNVNRDDTKNIIRKETAGRGVDIVIEAAGSYEALNAGLQVLKKAGTLLVYGVFGDAPAPVDVMPIQLFEFNVVGSCGLDYTAAINLIKQGTIPVKHLISHTFTLDELPEAFSSGFLEERRDNYTKGIVLFT